MRIGFVGLGKMGYKMTLRLLKSRHTVVAYNKTPEPTRKLAKKGAKPAYSLNELVGKLPKPRIVWLMVPHEAVDSVLEELTPLLSRGDIIVDGGNSNYKETRRRGDALETRGIHLVDCGTSGGLVGAKVGYCLMYGGDEMACKKLQPIFNALAMKDGHGRVGPRGAGHYVKMIHNGIEYGMMQSIGEGLEIIKSGPYKKINLKELCTIWNHGSIISSFLLQMMENALAQHPDLKDIAPVVAETGEGKWTVLEAMENKVPAENLALALFARWRSQQKDAFSAKAVAALREQFGGHKLVKK